MVRGSPRRSTTGGGVERYNQTIEKKMGAWMKDNNSQHWTIGARIMNWRYNTQVHSTLNGKSPYHVVYGQLPRIGISNLQLSQELLDKLHTEAELNELLGIDPIDEEEEEEEGDNNDDNQEDDALPPLPPPLAPDSPPRTPTVPSPTQHKDDEDASEGGGKMTKEDKEEFGKVSNVYDSVLECTEVTFHTNTLTNPLKTSLRKRNFCCVMSLCMQQKQMMTQLLPAISNERPSWECRRHLSCRWLQKQCLLQEHHHLFLRRENHPNISNQVVGQGGWSS